MHKSRLYVRKEKDKPFSALKSLKCKEMCPNIFFRNKFFLKPPFENPGYAPASVLFFPDDLCTCNYPSNTVLVSMLYKKADIFTVHRVFCKLRHVTQILNRQEELRLN